MFYLEKKANDECVNKGEKYIEWFVCTDQNRLCRSCRGCSRTSRAGCTPGTCLLQHHIYPDYCSLLGYTAESTHTPRRLFFLLGVACVLAVQLKLHSLGARLRPTSNASSFIILTNATSYSSQINQPVEHFYRVLRRRQPCGIFFLGFPRATLCAESLRNVVILYADCEIGDG